MNDKTTLIEAFRSRTASDTDILIGERGFTSERLGATKEGDDTVLADGYTFHPSAAEQPQLAMLLLIGYSPELAAAGYESPKIAAAALDAAIIEVAKIDGEDVQAPKAIFFPERSNFHPEDGDEETINLNDITYFRLA